MKMNYPAIKKGGMQETNMTAGVDGILSNPFSQSEEKGNDPTYLKGIRRSAVNEQMKPQVLSLNVKKFGEFQKEADA